MRNRIERIEHRWRQPPRWTPTDLLLMPMAALYGGAMALRRQLYRLGLLASQDLPVPTVVVGNVVTGGAGKTPVTIALAQALQQRGARVGVIARGYGRDTTDCREVGTNSLASEVGDEPLLVHRRTGVPVFVARRRLDAGRALLQAYPETTLLLCDDGLQHLALQRDVELCVFPDWGVGNGRLLPAGPLRERWPRPVDAVLQSVAGSAGATAPGAVIVVSAPLAGPVWPIERRLAAMACNANGEQLALQALALPMPESPLPEAAPRPLVAVAGIAQPQAFFSMLRARGVLLTRCIALADHHAFTQLPEALADLPPQAQVLCTEKDAVKLWPLLPEAWAVPLEVALPEALVDAVWTLARQRAAQRGVGG